MVAVVDTGVDRTHPELSDRIMYSSSFIDNDISNFDADEHGTAVAGIIGSKANNEVGIVGVAPEVKLMVLKACQQDDKTRRAHCDSYSLLKALTRVLALEPDILNLSLAGPPDPLIARLIDAILGKGDNCGRSCR
ncbi:MAG: major intracellular serine protease [Flavobacterium sp.]